MFVRFAYVPNYTDYTAAIGDVALVAEVVRYSCHWLADGCRPMMSQTVGFSV